MSVVRCVRGCGAALLAGVLLLAGCGDDGGPGPASAGPATGSGTPGRAPSPAVTLLTSKGTATLELRALSRTSDTVVTGHFRIVNTGSKPVYALDLGLGETGASDHPGLGDTLAASGIGLLDGRANKLYLPLHKAQGIPGDTCLCAKLAGHTIAPGQAYDVYALFPAPPADALVSVVTPTGLPWQALPIPAGDLAPLPGQPDPAATPLVPPRVLDLTAIAVGLDRSVQDEGEQHTLRLAADVLFAIDKADLTPASDTVLRQVAAEIDASTGTTVKVDGHADSTGTEARNQPLSEQRARTVADRLNALVTRPGVAYKVAGHGSRQPIDTNDTEQGRKRNRRVTITFTRPAPKPAPAAEAGTPYQYGATPRVLASANFTPAEAKALRAEVNGLHRDQSGVTVLIWTLRNTGQRPISFGTFFEKEYHLHGGWRPRRGWAAGGVMLYDPAAKVRYEPMYSASGACMCSSFGGLGGKQEIASGESVMLWGAYRTTPGTGPVDLQIPWAGDPKAANVPHLPIR